jgi:hypothetical protein
VLEPLHFQYDKRDPNSTYNCIEMDLRLHLFLNRKESLMGNYWQGRLVMRWKLNQLDQTNPDPDLIPEIC